jgi:hypothetical protein
MKTSKGPKLPGIPLGPMKPGIGPKITPPNIQPPSPGTRFIVPGKRSER